MASGVVHVIGSINVDCIIAVDHLPGAGETVLAGGMDRQCGGKGANQAVAAARDGASVFLMGAVGADEEAIASIANLVGEGIDVSGVVRLPHEPTGRAFVIVDSHGENEIIVVPGANAALDASLVEARFALLNATRGVCLIDFEIPDSAVIAAARIARERGDMLVVNPAPARPLPEALVACSPILTPNADEARTLSGCEQVEAAAHELSARTGNWVVVTLGAHGALVVRGPEVVRVRGHDVSAVDTTGAGDTFSGVLASALAAGLSVRDAAVRANAAGALSVVSKGPRPGMPRHDETDRFLQLEAVPE